MAVFAEPDAAQAERVSEVLNELRHSASSKLCLAERPSHVPESGWQSKNCVFLPVNISWASHATKALQPVPQVVHTSLALLQKGRTVLRREDTHRSTTANNIKASH